MPADLTPLLREPAQMIFGGATLYSQGPITVAPVQTMAQISASVSGYLEQRVINRVFRVSGVLSGEWRDLAVLFELLGKRPGESLFPTNGDNQAMVIHGIHTNKLTLKNAAITKPPQIIGKAGSTMFGSFEAMAIVGAGDDPSLAASYYTLATEAYPGDADFDPTKLLTLPLVANWGASAPWVDFTTRDGWQINNNVTLNMEDVDGHGTVAITVKDMTVTAQATPAGATRAQILAASSFGTGLGARRTGDDLVLTAAGVWMKVSGALMTNSGLANGDAPVVSASTWTAQRRWSAGAMVPLLEVGTAAPV